MTIAPEGSYFLPLLHDYFGYSVSGGKGIFVLPDSHHQPPRFGQATVGINVPLPVPPYLRCPKFTIRGGNRMVLRTAMPKTTIEEDSELQSSKYHIGSPPEAGQRADANTVAEPACMNSSSQSKLRAGISTAVALHPAPHIITR